MFRYNFSEYRYVRPIIPSRKKVTDAEVEAYLLAKCKPLLNVGRKYRGFASRTNYVTGEGVYLDYIGCSLYDSIVECNEKLKKLENDPSKNKEYWKLVAVFDRMRGIFSTSYMEAYIILVD